MRRYFQKGSPRIFDQLEKNVPYPKGHSTQRTEFRSGSKSPAWQRKEGKSASGGLNRKGLHLTEEQILVLNYLWL